MRQKPAYRRRGGSRWRAVLPGPAALWRIVGRHLRRRAHYRWEHKRIFTFVARAMIMGGCAIKQLLSSEIFKVFLGVLSTVAKDA